MKIHTIAKAPCKSCPYRRDVPSGVWHQHEYEKLPHYDGEIIDQVLNGATKLFDCHQRDGNLCAGWVGAHGANELLVMRLHADRVDPKVWNYESPIPLFGSGKEACDHGLKDLDQPGTKANQTIKRLLGKKGIKS